MCCKSYLSHQIYHSGGKNCTSAFDKEHIHTCQAKVHADTIPSVPLCPCPTGTNTSTWENPSKMNTDGNPVTYNKCLSLNYWSNKYIYNFFFLSTNIYSFYFPWLFFLLSVPRMSEIQNWYLNYFLEGWKRNFFIKC